jgi:hypothetical protein
MNNFGWSDGQLHNTADTDWLANATDDTSRETMAARVAGQAKAWFHRLPAIVLSDRGEFRIQANAEGQRVAAPYDLQRDEARAIFVRSAERLLRLAEEEQADEDEAEDTSEEAEDAPAEDEEALFEEKPAEESKETSEETDSDSETSEEVAEDDTESDEAESEPEQKEGRRRVRTARRRTARRRTAAHVPAKSNFRGSRTASDGYADYGWLIDRDYSEGDYQDGVGDKPSRRNTYATVEVMGPRGISPEIEAKLRSGKGQAFQLYDADGGLYYTGRWIEGDDPESNNPLDDYGAPNAGCTYMNVGNNQPYIGSRRTARRHTAGESVEVSSLPNCDLCGQQAHYDAKTVMGPWANLCELCFAEYGPGRLGTGYGQRLVVKSSRRRTANTSLVVDGVDLSDVDWNDPALIGELIERYYSYTPPSKGLPRPRPIEQAEAWAVEVAMIYSDKYRSTRPATAKRRRIAVGQISYSLYTNVDGGFMKPYQRGERLADGYSGKIEAADETWVTLERIFVRHNMDDRPDGQTNPSLSVGDVVVLGSGEAWSVNDAGFVQVEVDPADFLNMAWTDTRDLPERSAKRRRTAHRRTADYYKKSRPRDDGSGGTIYSGKDHADTIAEGLAANSRRRKFYSFSLTDDSPDRNRPCDLCGQSMTEGHVDVDVDGSNVTVAHSRCLWSGMVNVIVTSDDEAEAAEKFRQSQARRRTSRRRTAHRRTALNVGGVDWEVTETRFMESVSNTPRTDYDATYRGLDLSVEVRYRHNEDKTPLAVSYNVYDVSSGSARFVDDIPVGDFANLDVLVNQAMLGAIAEADAWADEDGYPGPALNQLQLFSKRRRTAGGAFPGAGAQVYYNEDGEPLGWDYPSDDEPDYGDPYEDEDAWAYEDREYNAARRRTSRRRTAMPNPVDLGVKVGDIFYSSWGYDQTNVDFYEVVGLTGASVKVREVAQERLSSDGYGSDQVVPVPGDYIGEVMTKRISDERHWSGRASIKISQSTYAYLWDGTPRRQTSMGWGH